MKTFHTKTNSEGLVNDDLFFDIRNYISKLKDKHIKIEISVKRKLRSNNQNKLYWAWLGLISKEANILEGSDLYTADDFHYSFRSMFLKNRGNLINCVESTTNLNTKEFTEYLNNIQKWVWDYLSSSFIFPLPEDLYT